MRLLLPPELAAAHVAAAESWRRRQGTLRLHARDATLWTGGGEAAWLGWLDAPARAVADLARYRELTALGREFADVLVLGMGGSSLAPEVQRGALGAAPGGPRLTVLDSIHPDRVAAVEAALDLASTLVVVASKSGSTLEPNLLIAHFAGRLEERLGAREAARRIVAVTDPGSGLERRARDAGWRQVVAGEPTIGGRFSALSPFGLVPAALQGIDLEGWLAAAGEMAARCRAEETAENPGVDLGLVLAAAARLGRDKLTLVVDPLLGDLGAWLEQLVAESTGKQGRGVLPFEGEPLMAPSRYGGDRLFVVVRLAGRVDPARGAALDALAAAGEPVVVIEVASPLALGAEFYRWEIATAVAGAQLGVDPFDQPDVEAAKLAARRLAAEVERSGDLPDDPALAEDATMSLHGAGDADGATVDELLRAHFAALGRGDYFALLAFCPPAAAEREAAARLRRAVLAATGVATSVGFGPRYLHSTGQAHKGGPPSGLFLVVEDRPRRDLELPGQRLSLGQAIAAQARGDADVLAERGRRVLRVALRGPAAELLPLLARRVEACLAAP